MEEAWMQAIGGGEEAPYTLLTKSSMAIDSEVSKALSNITRAVQMVTYGEEFSEPNNRSSAESNTTLPDRPSMMPYELLEFMDDAVAHFADMVHKAYSADNINDRVRQLGNIINFSQNVGFTDDQIYLLRSEPHLQSAVLALLFDMPDLRRQDETTHAVAARELLPIFGFDTEETILRFIIREWGSLPAMASNHIQTEYNDGMMRVIKPSSEEYVALEAEDDDATTALFTWMTIALPDDLMTFAPSRDHLIRIAVESFEALDDRFNPSSACLVLMVERMIEYGGIQTSAAPYASLPLLAMRTNLETMIVYTHMFPQLIVLEQPPQQPFNLAVALTVAFSARAPAEAILRILELALVTGILDTHSVVRSKFASGREGAVDVVNDYALMYGDRDVLEATSFTGKLMQRNKVKARARLPLTILISEMVKANPRLWDWLIRATRNDPSKKEMYYTLANDVIRERNQSQLWVPASQP